VKVLVKQPAEALKRELPIAGAAAVAQLVELTVQSRGLVAGSAPIEAAGSLTAGMLFVDIAGGSDGERYLVTARIEDIAGEIHEGEMEIAVLDAAWSMPDGGAGYVTIADFVEQFGFEETVRMTDAEGDGRIDRQLLVSKLRAAQAIAEVHIGARFALPLDPVPEIVKVAIGDMARARLYPRGAPDGVADPAKAALKLMQQIGEGKLPIASAAPIAEAPSSSPILISPGRRQYPDWLRGY
jgi:phage gp36-like protein